MNEPLNILAPTRYPWRFNSPRASRHHIETRAFAPLNKLSPKLEGVTFFNPFPMRRFDLVHAFNRIPLGGAPFIIGFESHLPRGFGMENTAYFAWMRRRLASPQCRAIIAISQYARGQFLRQHEGKPEADALAAKLCVRYPNMPVPATTEEVAVVPGAPLRLVFVGNHFARKGGVVALRLARLAQEKGFPLEIDIVSALEVGAASWVDPTAPAFFEDDLHALRALSNVRHHGRLANEDVLDLVRRAHFSFLPTLSDSFGYSAIEAMMNATPMLVTKQGALPEFIQDGVNGIVLPLETDAAGEWRHIARGDRGSAAYEALFNEEMNRLARAALARLEQTAADPAGYAAMRRAARQTACALFSADDANVFWDSFYEKALGR